MIADVQDALKELIYTDAGLPRDAIDVRFATPTGTWVSGLTRPTLNFFLHDIRENVGLRHVEGQTFLGAGAVTRHLAPRRIDLRYLITVFFKGHVEEYGRNEWNVLWRVLTTLMRHDEWPEERVPPAARSLGLSLLGQVAQPEQARTGEVFSSLGLSVRPHLTYTLTAPLDLGVSATAPLVLERDLGFSLGVEDPSPAETLIRSSWLLRDEIGEPLADALVIADGGARGFTDLQGVVHLRVRREEVRRLQVMTLGGRRLTLDAGTPGARLVLPA